MKLTAANALDWTSRFLRWWGAELRTCLEDLMNAFMPWRRRVLRVYWDATRLLIVEDRLVKDNSSQANTLIEMTADDLPDAAPPQLKQVLEGGRRARLFVSKNRAYLREVQVPSGVLPHLDGVIALQMPKLLPLETADLMIDFGVAARDVPNNCADIEIAALRKMEISQVLNRLRTWGLEIVSIHLGDPSSATSRFKFSDAGAIYHGPKLQKIDRLLIATAATLGLACASVAATETYRSSVTLQDAKEQMRTPATAALGHRQELLARLEPLRALSELERTPSPAALLAELTMLVPQNTYLTTLELQHGAIRIVGVSPNPGSVVKLLSSSKLLNEVALRSSMSVGIGTGLDRFEVTADLKGAP